MSSGHDHSRPARQRSRRYALSASHVFSPGASASAAAAARKAALISETLICVTASSAIGVRTHERPQRRLQPGDAGGLTLVVRDKFLVVLSEIIHPIPVPNAATAALG